MITDTQYNMFDKLYSHYNNELFDGKLNDCMITTSSGKGYYGYFQPHNWKENSAKKELDIHEVKDHRHSRWLEEAPLKGAKS